ILKALQVERSFKPDIVHVHWPIPNVLWALPFSGKRVLHCHSTGLTLVRKYPILGKLLHRPIFSSDFIVFNSTFSMKDFAKVMGKQHPNSKVIPMPVSFEPKVLNVKRDPKKILFVGRNVYWKGVDILIKALALLNERGINATLTVVGEGPQQKEWKNLADQLGVPVIFKGWISQKELSREYATAKVLVLPSRAVPDGWTEGLGVVLIEAMMHGTPVIASRAGGPLDVIVEGKNGFFFEVENEKDLSDKLWMLLGDPALWHSLSQNAKHTAKRYMPLNIAKEFLSLYLTIHD
ncbi:MAG: glycosyltransferase family 4 protein, partial [Thermotogae bacterium]|nr:glycosyltransferase family 4 protein [Thermotogota bacterium]